MLCISSYLNFNSYWRCLKMGITKTRNHHWFPPHLSLSFLLNVLELISLLFGCIELVCYSHSISVSEKFCTQTNPNTSGSAQPLPVLKGVKVVSHHSPRL